jgi:hypothetical protein
MAENLKTDRPPRAPFDSHVERDESQVREREDAGARSPTGSGTYAAQTESTPAEATQSGPISSRPSSESVGERTTRIENKVAMATLVLEKLSPTDSRARLLASAVLRRDEVLIDAVLAQMSEEIVGLLATRRGPSNAW